MSIKRPRKPLNASFWGQYEYARIDWDNVSRENCKDEITELFKTYGYIKFYYRYDCQILMYIEDYDQAMRASRDLNRRKWPDATEIQFKVQPRIASSFLHAAEELYFNFNI